MQNPGASRKHHDKDDHRNEQRITQIRLFNDQQAQEAQNDNERQKSFPEIFNFILFAGQKIRELITVNGVRIVLEDGTWGLVRASSNKPELVVVVESPTSEANMRAIFEEIDDHLATMPEVGAYNQKI